jgi:site-specific DNA-methyltransferase (adenine-specific)
VSKEDDRGTRSSPFGAPGRISHDSSPFYDSRLYAGRQPEEGPIEYTESALEQAQLDVIHRSSSERMSELPDHSVHLMITSPPYNASKIYDDDLTLEEYMGLLRRVFSETMRVLVPGGRACINIANLGRKPYIPLHAHLIHEMLDLGYYMRGEIIWNKASSAGASTAWGSWRSAANPVLRDVHEYILVFSKATFSRDGRERVSSISREDFLQLTKSVWTFPSVSARQIGHPAPFPEELPRRLIELYSFQGDLVLDPFCGSGSTCLAAKRCGRRYVGYEINPSYAELAERRLGELDTEKSTEGSG